MNQAMIEKKVGITPEVAVYIMSANTAHSRTAMDLLALAVKHPDPPTMALLESAVLDCIRDVEKLKFDPNSTQSVMARLMEDDS